MRRFTGARPTSSRSSSSSTAPTAGGLESAARDRSTVRRRGVHRRLGSASPVGLVGRHRRGSCSGWRGRSTSCRSSAKPGSSAGRFDDEGQSQVSQPASRRRPISADVGVGRHALAAFAELASARRPGPSDRTSAGPTSPSRCCGDAGRRCTRCSPPSRCRCSTATCAVICVVGQVGQEAEGALGEAHWAGLSASAARETAVGRSRACRSTRSRRSRPSRASSAWRQRRAVPGGRCRISGPSRHDVAALVARQHHGFERDAVGDGAGRRCPSGGRWCRRRTAAPRPRRAGRAAGASARHGCRPRRPASPCCSPAQSCSKNSAVLAVAPGCGVAADVVVARSRRAGRLRACRPRCRHGCGRRRRGASTWR